MLYRTSVYLLIVHMALPGQAVSDQDSFDRTSAVIEAVRDFVYEKSFDLALIETDPELNNDAGSCWPRHARKMSLMQCLNAANEVCERELVKCLAEEMIAVTEKTNEYETEQTKIDDRKTQKEHELFLKDHERLLDVHAKKHAEWLAAEDARRIAAEKQLDEKPQ